MKALSIKQPWAELIASGKKDIENRTWKTNYRGRVLIHATKSNKMFTVSDCDLIENHMSKDEYDDSLTNIGKIIGEFEIVDCVRDSKSEWAQDNCWHWVLKNQKKYAIPIDGVKGKLQLWNYNIEEEKEVK